MTCSYCRRPAHKDEPVVQNFGAKAKAWMHVDCYLRRQIIRRPAAVMARIQELLGARVVLH